jgi:hypothetical protein
MSRFDGIGLAPFRYQKAIGLVPTAPTRRETLTQSEHPEASPAGQGELQLPLCYPFWIGPLPPLDLHLLKC